MFGVFDACCYDENQAPLTGSRSALIGQLLEHVFARLSLDLSRVLCL